MISRSNKSLRHFALAFADAHYRDIGTDILKDHDPVGVVLIDRGIERHYDRSGDYDIVRQRIGHIAQPLYRRGLRRRHLYESVRRLRLGDARRRDRVLRQPLEALQIELGPLRLWQRPIAGVRHSLAPISQYRTGDRS